VAQLALPAAVLTACTFALAPSGCALSPAPQSAEVLARALPEGTTVPPAYEAAPLAGEVTGDWVASFQDRGLDAVVAEAIANNLDLRQAAAVVEVARQTVVVLGSVLKPQIGASFGESATRDDGNDKWFDANREYLGISWEIDLWGRLRAQRSSAEAEFEASALDYAFARQSLAATTAKSWYSTIEARELLELAEQNVAVYEDLLELVKLRRDAGKVADLDVAEASADLNTAQSKLRTALGVYSEARRGLELLLGRYPAAEIEVAQGFAPLPPPVPAGLPSALLERRPDLLAAQQGVLATFRMQEAAELALLPSFSLALEGGRLGDNLLSLLRLNPWLVHGAIGMQVPIYQGGALRAQIEIATAEQEQAVAEFGNAALTAFAEIETLLTNEELLAQRLQYQSDALADRTESVRIANVRYEAGSLDLLSVLELLAGQIETESDLIQLRYAQLANRIDLHLALGGSFDAAPVVAGPPQN